MEYFRLILLFFFFFFLNPSCPPENTKILLICSLFKINLPSPTALHLSNRRCLSPDQCTISFEIEVFLRILVEVEPPTPLRYIIGAVVMMVGVVLPVGFMMFRNKRRQKKERKKSEDNDIDLFVVKAVQVESFYSPSYLLDVVNARFFIEYVQI
ncbi:hypothetical protein M9H77_32914 [Catharanthus roseus]|uniref:Uncharacterized protein n=1 Tax=Catharanthus roseus TaxID=4058 RepID=A0ACC0A6Z6_CATRO|nr:hypothetical protein M9H77_32914 [Catharanthus roseus]